MAKKKKNVFNNEKADPNGSWTGTVAFDDKEEPVQDADDL